MASWAVLGPRHSWLSRTQQGLARPCARQSPHQPPRRLRLRLSPHLSRTGPSLAQTWAAHMAAQGHALAPRRRLPLRLGRRCPLLGCQLHWATQALCRHHLQLLAAKGWSRTSRTTAPRCRSCSIRQGRREQEGHCWQRSQCLALARAQLKHARGRGPAPSLPREA